jgi:hypothetical protein
MDTSVAEARFDTGGLGTGLGEEEPEAREAAVSLLGLRQAESGPEYACNPV